MCLCEAGVCVFGGVDFCFGLSVLKSVRWAGYIKGRARCSCVAAGFAAPLQHSDCDPSLRVCVCVCVFILFVHTL